MLAAIPHGKDEFRLVPIIFVFLIKMKTKKQIWDTAERVPAV
jgi:hypothetical protein